MRPAWHSPLFIFCTTSASTITTKMWSVDYWLQMCTLCQSQLYVSQSLFLVMCLRCKALQCGLVDLLLFSISSKDRPASASLSVVFKASLTQTHTELFFSVIPPGNWDEFEPKLCLPRETHQTGTGFPYEMHSDDVCMNIFMSDIDTGGETRATKRKTN